MSRANIIPRQNSFAHGPASENMRQTTRHRKENTTGPMPERRNNVTAATLKEILDKHLHWIRKAVDYVL
jgi:hypothetical protein